MAPAKPHVTAVTATFRRKPQMLALLGALAASGSPPDGLVIVDNGGDLSAETLPASPRLEVRLLSPGRNLGCGGGIAAGIAAAMADPRTTHVWVLDDDVEPVGRILPELIGALAATGAGAAVPLVCDESGVLGWPPGPLPGRAWNIIRRPGITPASFRVLCGEAPLPWRWTPWPCLLVTRCAVEAAGLPRDDFWFCGEDLEWSLRIAARFQAILVPGSLCRHLQPSKQGDPLRHRERERLKSLSMLQNNLYTATRLPHGRPLLRHAPGNALRFLASRRFAPRDVADAIRAHWLGGILGRPAGAPGCNPWSSQWARALQPGDSRLGAAAPRK